MTCGIYARVSTVDQNCSLQLSELHGVAERNGWEYLEYVDEGYSGAKRNRPALNRLMDDARLRKFDCVIAWKLDRFGRSTLDLIQNIQTLADLGIRFMCPTQGIDTDQKSPVSKLVMTILAAIADFERELIRERVSAGLSEYRRAHASGKIGLDRHSRSGRDLPIGRPRRIFRRDEALRLRDSGLSLRAIARQLEISEGTVRNLLKAA